jgi:hypothetical protein
MSQEWWVCTYCYRSNHPLWSKCQTCRAPRSQPADAYGAAQKAGETSGATGSGDSAEAQARREPVAQPSAKSGAVKLAAVVEPAAAKAAAPPKRSRRKAARNGHEPDNACPKCGQVMEDEWNHCPRCGSARVRAKAPEIKLVPLPPPSTRPLRRLGMVQPVPDPVESNGNHPAEEGDDQGSVG